MLYALQVLTTKAGSKKVRQPLRDFVGEHILNTTLIVEMAG
jgi:hypothetical protein